MNLWREIEAGDKEKINVIVEINKGSKNKYEIDKKTGLIALDRTSYTTQEFPFDYGFIPQTLWDDGDAVAVVLLTTYPLFPGLLVRVRPVGVMHMVDAGEPDDKIIAVPLDDPRWDKVRNLSEINPHTLKEMEHFYSTYKQLQDKVVSVKGFADKTEAEKVFERGRKLYRERYQV